MGFRFNPEIFQGYFGKCSGQRYETAAHCENKVEKIIAGVDGAQSNGKWKKYETRAFAGKLKSAVGNAYGKNGFIYLLYVQGTIQKSRTWL